MATIGDSPTDSGSGSGQAYRVSLNHNTVDGASMTGGYNAWQLLPYGPRVAPVTKVNGPYTISQATKLVFYKPDNQTDVYLPTAGSDFNRDEAITIQGPNQQDGGRDIVVMQGADSGTIVSWALNAA